MYISYQQGKQERVVQAEGSSLEVRQGSGGGRYTRVRDQHSGGQWGPQQWARRPGCRGQGACTESADSVLKQLNYTSDERGREGGRVGSEMSRESLR